MSLKYSSTTADYLIWSDAMNLIRKLAKDENYKISLLIALGCFTGLRISDITATFSIRHVPKNGHSIASISFLSSDIPIPNISIIINSIISIIFLCFFISISPFPSYLYSTLIIHFYRPKEICSTFLQS